jgi:uncharacterized membrane protein
LHLLNTYSIEIQSVLKGKFCEEDIERCVKIESMNIQDQSIEPKSSLSLSRFYHTLNAAALIGMTIMLGAAFRSLPEKIPVHFGPSGQPDRFTGKDSPELIVLFAIPWFLSLVMYAMGYFIPRFAEKNPAMVNIPYKDEIFALPPEKRKPLWDLLSEMFFGMACALNLLFLFIFYSTIQVAMGRMSGLPVAPMIGLIILVFACVIIYTVKIFTVSRSLTDATSQR